MTVTNEDIVRDIAALKNEMADFSNELKELRRTLIGSYDAPGGLAIAVLRNERDIALLKADFVTYGKRREELVAEFDARVEDLEEWVKAMKNRAIGITIGLSLGSAGIGAGVSALISNMFGG